MKPEEATGSVLIVDDERDLRTMLQRFHTRMANIPEGRILTAANYDQALVTLDELQQLPKPHLLYLDYAFIDRVTAAQRELNLRRVGQTPTPELIYGETGLDVITILKERDMLHTPPLYIIATGDFPDEDLERLLSDRTFFARLEKPFELRIFQGIIQRVREHYATTSSSQP